ncbi:MAG: hypothetical protein ACKOUT_02320 [Novosphingobium sp.]
MAQPPDLGDPAARKAYRGELRALYRGWRLAGLLLVIAGAALLAWPRIGGPWMLGPMPMQAAGWLLVAAGWAIFAWVIVKRTRYHVRRMRG